MSAVGDLIATVRRRKKPRVSPTGSSVARKTATKVLAEVSDATQAVIDATQASARYRRADKPDGPDGPDRPLIRRLPGPSHRTRTRVASSSNRSGL